MFDGRTTSSGNPVSILTLDELISAVRSVDPDGLMAMRARLYSLAERMDKGQLAIQILSAEWQLAQAEGVERG